MCMYMQLKATNKIFFNHNKGKNKNSEHPGIKRKKKVLTLQTFLHMLQTDFCVWVDADLKELKQAGLQKSFIVPLVSTAAMMRSRGCDIALIEGEDKHLTQTLIYPITILPAQRQTGEIN